MRTRQQPIRVHWVCVVLALAGVGAAQLVLQVAGIGDMMFFLVMLLIGFGLPLLALHFIGPWLVAGVVLIQLGVAASRPTLRAVLRG